MAQVSPIPRLARTEAEPLLATIGNTPLIRLEKIPLEYPSVEILSERRYVDEGHIVTSAGVSAGIDMSLHLVARECGQAIAAWTARRMEYPWPKRRPSNS